MTSADAPGSGVETEPLAPVPDDKDWTWTLQRACPECGFNAASIEPVAIPALVRDAVSRWPDVLARSEAAARPAPATWSALEYACHVRDVCGIFGQRLELMLGEERPTFANWDQDETALRERYWQQDPAVVSSEVGRSGEDLAQAYERVGDRDWTRAGVRSDGSVFTVESLGRYLLHDLYHHVWDVGG
ncbi:MAG: DinB family protein [Actinomycetota bacterium]|nr:DinB family protein [Actinomycetota bacterium]